MARSHKPEPPPTLEARLDQDIKLSGGTMPICIVVGSEAEADEARRLVKTKRGAKLITVKVEVRGG